MAPLHGQPDSPAAVISGQISAEQASRPLSVRDMFRVGIGPSSSHTVGPMRAGLHFTQHLAIPEGTKLGRVVVELMGSLGATGKGHSTDRAVLLGLAGYSPESVPIEVVDTLMENAERTGLLKVAGAGEVGFIAERDILFLPGKILPFHVNALTIRALAEDGLIVGECTYYSVGGGFVMEECGDAEGASRVRPLASQSDAACDPAPYPYSSAAQLLAYCEREGMRISDVVEANELALASEAELRDALDGIVAAMRESIEAGCSTEGMLPGILKVRRRAPKLMADLLARQSSAGGEADELAGMDWVNLYALAVNEENAAGHRVVTAPTNGAAGVIPAVLAYYIRRKGGVKECVHRFLLTAAAIGGLIKTNASIAGAEVGCQGEIGSACAMAAAGLAEAMGGVPRQVENAAEIAMEHCLGLTCDPVGGLVQIPCIERNAIAAVKAINAARMALWGDGRHTVSFDTVIETMRQTGADMLSKYKETSRGGLAVNVVEC